MTYYQEIQEELIMDQREALNLRLFFFLSYLIFWALLAFTGVLIYLDVPTNIQVIMKNICAWSPTFALLILFKKLFPDKNIRDFMKMSFAGKLNVRDFIVPLLIQIFALVFTISTYLLITMKPFHSLIFINIGSILPIFLINLTSGPMGEELGWRGYALGVLRRKYSPLKASTILGLVWGFWHLPLWFLSGYSGIELLVYSIFFLIGIVSTSILIDFFYNKHKNVLIAIWIHFLFNFLLQLIDIEFLTMIIYMGVYFLIALVLVTLNRENMLRKPGTTLQH